MEQVGQGAGGLTFWCQKILLRTYLTFPVTLATSKHSFSALRWLKNYLTSTMTEGWTTAYRCIVTNQLWTHWTLWKLDRGLLAPTKNAKGILENLSRGFVHGWVKMFTLIDRSLHPTGCMPWIILRLWGFLCVRDTGCRGNKITGY